MSLTGVISIAIVNSGGRPGGDSNKESITIDTLVSVIGLSQLIFKKNSAHHVLTSSFVTNPVIESGTQPSLDPFCKHQIIFCRRNYLIPPPPQHLPFNGNNQLVKNYMPISLLPICAKIFETLLFKHLENYFQSNNLITKKQSGVRPGDSTTNQLIDFHHEIHQ